MTDTVARLRQLEAAATPAPWRGVPISWSSDMSAGCEDADTDLIVSARNALPQLLDIAEAALADLTRDGTLPLSIPTGTQPGVDPDAHFGRHKRRMRQALLALATIDSQETE